jgi:hypothetical protein
LHPPTLYFAQRRAIQIKVQHVEEAKAINVGVTTFIASRQRDKIPQRGLFNVDGQLILEGADRLYQFAMYLWRDFQYHIDVESLRPQRFKHHGCPTDQIQPCRATQSGAQALQKFRNANTVNPRS